MITRDVNDIKNPLDIALERNLNPAKRDKKLMIYPLIVCHISTEIKVNKSYMSIFLLVICSSILNSCIYSQPINENHEYVIIKGGVFQMGSEDADESAQHLHEVTLDDFKIGKFEVSNKQYCEFLNAKGNNDGKGGTWLYLEYSQIEKKGNQFFPKPGYERHPVVVVSWEGATVFAKWRGARLPTEAEWEYAARGGQLTKGYSYSGSNQIDEIGWFSDNSENKTHAVGQKKSNELGIYDMSGNVWEWCSDWYDEAYYKLSPQQNPKGPDTGLAKVLRGGELQFKEKYCRIYNRYNISPNARNTRIGFRIAKSL